MTLEILFVHQGYPAQFVHLEAALLARSDRITAIRRRRSSRRSAPSPSNASRSEVIRLLEYPIKTGNTVGLSPFLQEVETKVLRATWVAELAGSLCDEYWQPDLIIAHPGWGEVLFLADIWPEVPQLHYLEFDYGSGVDMYFDPEFSAQPTWQARARQRMKTANTLLNLQAMTWGYTPTQFQWSTLPAAYRQRVSVIHDGIDTARLRPDPFAVFTLPNGLKIRPGDPLLTFVNRTFEPYRGVHRLLRALPELQRRLPALQVLLIGRDSPHVSYGQSRTDSRGWLAALRDELDGELDWSRIHAPGSLPHSQFIRAMQVSAVHVYFTYPFVLSWSLLEAMSCGALVIGSATAPVQEVIQDGINGLLVDFHDQRALIDCVSRVIAVPNEFSPLRIAARRTVKERYSLDDCINKQLRLIDAVASGCLSSLLAN